jgi:septal ring factor EnvC (AmiA/AmiB activator)
MAGLLGAANPAWAASDTKPEQDLAGIRAAIAKLQREMDAARRDQGDAARALSEKERAIDALARDRRRLAANAEELRAELVRLNKTRRELGQQVDEERAALGQHLRVAYALGREERLKLILQQRDPGTIARVLRYHQNLGHQRSERIASLQQVIARVETTETAIAEESRRLESVVAEHAAREKALQAERVEREKLLAALDAQLAGSSEKLDALKRDRKRLATLIRKLRDVISDIPADAEPPRSFKKLRGRLPWPVRGRISRRFGTPRPETGLSWQGVVLEARAGQDVRAVAHGRVVFANWLRGFGQMIILDHGNGYMSLYGHNEALLREPGEWVNPGDPLATVGDSGSLSRAGLYFEIRRDGRPENPSRWCSRRARFRAAL